MKYIQYLFVCTILLTGTTTFAQESYFKDARDLKYFMKYKKVLEQKTFTFTTSGKTLVVKEEDNFETLLERLASAITAQPDTRNTAIVDTAEENAGGGLPGRGGNNQPRTGQNRQPGKKAPTGTFLQTDEKVEMTKELIREELKYLLLITDGTPEAIKAAPEMPRRFTYLSKINTALELETKAPKLDLQSTALSGNFAFNESAIIYAITDFAIKRAKQEMLEAQLGEIYKNLQSDSIIQTLIPNTLKTFKQFNDDNSTSLSKYGDLWKASFQQDLQNFPLVLQQESFLLAVGTRIKADLATNGPFKKEIVPAIAGSSELIYSIYLKKHIVTILQDMAAKYRTNTTPAPLPVFKKAVIFSDVVSSIVGQFKDDKYTLITSEVINNMSLEEWWYFARLTYLRHKTDLLLVADSTVITQLTDNTNEKVVAFLKQWLIPALNTYTAYQEIIGRPAKGIAANEPKTLDAEDVRKLITLSFQLADNAITLLSKNPLQTTHDMQLDSLYHNYVQPFFVTANQIGEGIAVRDYGKVLDGTLQALSIVQTKYESKKLDTLINRLTTYGSFMVNVLKAKEPEDIEAALDELIPRGQYKLKYKAQWSASLSCYPGAFFGREQITKYNVSSGTVQRDSSTHSTAGSLAFYLPIGIDINYGIADKWCVSAFFQMLDLGAVLNYRLNAEDATEQATPEISLKQVLSPGANLMLHFPNSPFVAGLGVNYTPDLRKIEDSGVSYKANALRYGLFLGVDVTMFHIGLKRKK